MDNSNTTGISQQMTNIPPVGMVADGRELTYGEKAVGLTFNPSNDPQVQEIKKLYAKIIDNIYNSVPVFEQEEASRLALKAIREAQTAQMWAVKAITWKF